MSATAVLFVLLIGLQLHRVATGSILYDDAYNASVAKNLALGHGYVTSYERIIPFNPEITTGPALILPAALLIKLVGNRYWTPNLTATAVIVGLLALILALARGLDLSPRRRAAFGALWLLLAWHSISYPTTSPAWSSFVGEIPAGLFIVAAALVLFAGGPGTRTRHAFFAGLLVAAGILTKSLVLAGAPGLLAVLLIREGAVARGRAGRMLRAGAAFGLGCLALPLLFELYKLAVVGPAAYPGLKQQELFFVNNFGSGLNQVRGAADPAAAMAGYFTTNARILVKYFGGLPYLLAFAAALALAGWHAPRRSPATAAGAALLLGGLIHFAWWLLLHPFGYLRHAEIGLVYLYASLALLLAAALPPLGRAAAARKPAGALAAVALVAVLFVPRAGMAGYLAPRSWDKEPRLAALLATADFIQAHRAELRFFGAGWWADRDLEFVLPRTGNFQDATGPGLAAPADRPAALVRSEYWNWEHSPALQALEPRGADRVLFRAPPFEVSVLAGPVAPPAH